MLCCVWCASAVQLRGTQVLLPTHPTDHLPCGSIDLSACRGAVPRAAGLVWHHQALRPDQGPGDWNEQGVRMRWFGWLWDGRTKGRACGGRVARLPRLCCVWWCACSRCVPACCACPGLRMPWPTIPACSPARPPPDAPRRCFLRLPASRSYGFVVYEDPNVTDVACAGLNGMQVGVAVCCVAAGAAVLPLQLCRLRGGGSSGDTCRA